MALTAQELVDAINQMGLSLDDVAKAFGAAKIAVQSKTLSTLIDAALQKDAALRVDEQAQLAPFQQALDEKRSELDAVASQRANQIAAARQLLNEVAAGRILSDEELADLQKALGV